MGKVSLGSLLTLFLAGPVLSQQSTWTTIRPVELGLHSNIVTALYQDRGTRLWIGTAVGDIAVFDGSKWEIVAAQDRPRYISKIILDRAGTLWAISSGSLWRYVDNNWKRYGGTVGYGIGKVVTRVGGSDCWDRQIVGVDPEITDGVPFISGDAVDIDFDEDGILWCGPQAHRRDFSASAS